MRKVLVIISIILGGILGVICILLALIIIGRYIPSFSKRDVIDILGGKDMHIISKNAYNDDAIGEFWCIEKVTIDSLTYSFDQSRPNQFGVSRNLLTNHKRTPWLSVQSDSTLPPICWLFLANRNMTPYGKNIHNEFRQSLNSGASYYSIIYEHSLEDVNEFQSAYFCCFDTAQCILYICESNN